MRGFSYLQEDGGATPSFVSVTGRHAGPAARPRPSFCWPFALCASVIAVTGPHLFHSSV